MLLVWHGCGASASRCVTVWWVAQVARVGGTCVPLRVTTRFSHERPQHRLDRALGNIDPSRQLLQHM